MSLPSQMESPTTGKASRIVSRMQAPSRSLEAPTPASLSNTRDTQSSNIDQINEQPYSNPISRVCLNLIQAEHDQSTLATLDGLEPPIQSSGEILMSNSEDDQDPDNPLHSHENADAALPGPPVEPWVGDIFGIRAGIIPCFQIKMSAFSIFFICVGILMWILIFSAVNTRNSEFWEKSSDCISSLFINLMFGIVLSFILFVIMCVVTESSPNKLNFWILIVTGATVFGLCSWLYIGLLANSVISYCDYPWFTETMPQSFRGCDARVEPQQASLFWADIYDTQLARTKHVDSDLEVSYSAFDMDLSRSIQMNQTLCNQGFAGNADLYGLGNRTGLYLLWISSLLANNLLLKTWQELQKVYLIFSLAFCLATVIASFTKNCTFGIEIEIMYWMYWGGFVCVFASAPCPVQLGSKIKWIKLDWTTVILFTTHTLMTYHGVWFVLYAYDQVFSRMPCGTYQFFLVPMLDPSEGFWALRGYLTLSMLPWVLSLLAVFPFVVLLLASEIKHSIQHSAIYQILFPRSMISDCDQAQTTGLNASAKTSLGLRVYLLIKRRYIVFRESFRLPSHSREGIRLVTPIDVRNRRLYRIRWAATGLLSYILSIVAIEMTLKWNKVRGVYSITSTGQYLPLMVGVTSFGSLCWSLLQQEAERRRNLRRRQIINQDEDDIALDSLSHTLTDAISHAFAQPDIGFLTNGGALPITSDEEEEEVAISDSPGSSTGFHGPHNQYFMSGALGANPDLEAQTTTNS